MSENELDQREQKVVWVKEKLEEIYEPPEREQGATPLETLIRTILSQNTNDKNRDRAWAGLREKFPHFRELEKAPTEEIARAIAPGGLQNQKARTIKGVLTQLKEDRGELRLDFLGDMSLKEALEKLTQFKGVGKKTAGIVLLFSLDKPYFPVDTHVGRVTTRLGLVKNGEDHHDLLNQVVPNRFKYQLHLHLIRHGREICHARGPECSNCALLSRCPHGQSRESEQ